MTQNITFDRALIEKYDPPGPRYTSYPTAPQFHQAFAMDDYAAAAKASNAEAAPKTLSAYIHIPFCKSPCYYCACNTFIPHTPVPAVEARETLKRQVAL